MNVLKKMLLKTAGVLLDMVDAKKFKIQFGDYFNAYTQNDKISSWVFVSMDILGKYFAKANFRVYKRTENDLFELKDHPINQIFKNPNPYQTFWSIKYRWAFHLALYGNSYLLKLRNKFGVPAAVIQLKPFNVEPIIENGVLKYFKYKNGGQELTLKNEDVINLIYPDPDNVIIGRPIISNILDQVEVDQLQTKYQKQFYKSGGFLGQTFVAHKELSKTTFERMQEELQKRYGGGYENAYKVALLELVEPVKSAYSIKDMELTIQRQLSREEIMAAFQIPKILAGIGENINRATAEASIYQFTSGVVDPLCSYFDEILTKSFALDFEGGENLVIEHDPLAPKDTEANINYYKNGLNDGWLTLNDVRELENYPKYDFPEADVPIIALNRAQIDFYKETPNKKKDFVMETKALKIQTIIFDKKFFTLEEARKWIKDHNFQDNGVDETENSYRFRQLDPELFEPDSFRTITLTEGVKAVVGKLKGSKNINAIDYLKFAKNFLN